MDEFCKVVLMSKVERNVCATVSKILAGDVNPHDLYIGIGNIPVIRAVARNFTFYILHNRFGLSYSDLSKRAGMTKESVMRCIRKVQYLSESDYMYQNIMEKVYE